MYELAIYGGTFAPVHKGHVHAAISFFEEIQPDKLLIIPTLIPPHKQLDFKDNPSDRLEMLRLAFEDHPQYGKKIFLSDYELNTPPPSYTVNTLKHFSSPDTHITFLVGTDMFLTLDKWYKPEEIFKLCTVALMRREASNGEISALIDKKLVDYRNKYGADIKIINTPPIEISSSEMRLGDDEAMKKFLPRAVYDYVKEMRLYEDNRSGT